MATELANAPTVGPMLREWRLRRRLSQLELALSAGISARHVSFVETGRSRPSADLVLRLAEHLEVPLRERNRLLLAAGHAPVYEQRSLDGDPELQPVRDALEAVLAGHEPHPAVVVDRHWGMVAANRPLGALIEGAAPELLEPPVNVLRLTLHPDGLAARIVNLGEWREHLLARLGREAEATGDSALAALHDELSAYPVPPGGPPPAALDASRPGGAIAVPLRLRAPDGGVLSFIGTVATFGTAVDVTVAELSIESFFPADAETARAMRELAGASGTRATAG